MSDETRARVRELLEAHTTMTLATSGPDGPWAAAVFYASDPALRLYFLSDPRTRHGRDLAATPRAAAAIHADCRAWSEIRGLQLAGPVSVLDGAARDDALALYLARFPEVRALTETPRGPDEATIARRLAAATLYCLAPARVRLIDNSRGFGFKEELALD
jgi:uncharacterized protein YhbP (UPF0306 family)